MVAIRRLTPSSAPEDVDAAAQLLTTAFADDQLTRIVSGPVPGLHAARMRSTLVTGVLDLVVFAAYDSDDEGGQMLGVLILKPPGVVDRHSANSEGPHDQPVQRLLAGPGGEVVRASYARLRRHVHALEEAAFGGVTDVWFVGFVGVAPAAQGKGVGRLLCDAASRLVRDSADGTSTSTLALVAISEEAMRFYKRLGFVERGYVEFSVGPELVRRWAMSTEC